MSNDKSIIDQVCDMQLIVSDLKMAGIDLIEEFQVKVFISKLPSTRNNYNKKLMHNKKKWSLEFLNVIFESKRIRENTGR